jgi:hypothetical protein
MADMITAQEIALLTGQELDAENIQRIELLIEFSLGEIEAYLGRPVTVREFEEKMVPDHHGTCYFSMTPVVTIDDLEINGTAYVPDELVTKTPFGFTDLWNGYNSFGSAITPSMLSYGYSGRQDVYGADIFVRYTAGLDFPSVIRSLVARGVARKSLEDEGNRVRREEGHTGMRRIQVEDFMVEYDRPLASSRSSGTSSILVFESETDFYPIRRLKRRGFA